MNIKTYEYIFILTFCICLYKTLILKLRFSYFTFFITIAFTFELFIEHYISKIFKTNVLAYNYFAVFCVLSYSVIFLDEIKKIDKAKYINIYKGIIIIWLAFSIIRLNKIENLIFIDSTIYNSGMLVVLFLIGYYFYSFISMEKLNLNFLNPNIYLGLGILIFYCSAFPIITFINELIINPHVKSIYQDLLQIGNIFLSLGYLGAAICIRKEAKSTI